MAGIRFVLLAGLVFGVGVGSVRATTPFGGDDTGFVAPDKGSLKCEDGLSKKVGSLVTALIKCNIKDSDDLLKGKTFDLPGCQAQGTGKWDTTTMALVCPPCISKNGIRDLTVTLVNLNGGVVYCDNTSGTPQDSPNTGFVPANKALAKCEDGAAKNAGKLTTAIGKCHVKASDDAFKGKTFDEEGCETAALSKGAQADGLLTGCPSCLNSAGLASLRALVENLLDSNNNQAYCASPSGAFLN